MPIKKRLEELSYLKVEHDAQIMYIKSPPSGEHVCTFHAAHQALNFVFFVM